MATSKSQIGDATGCEQAAFELHTAFGSLAPKAPETRINAIANFMVSLSVKNEALKAR